MHITVTVPKGEDVGRRLRETKVVNRDKNFTCRLSSFFTMLPSNKTRILGKQDVQVGS